MNGISSTLKEEIKKSQDSKKKEKFKFIAAIVITNIMVAILCLPSSKEQIVATPTISKTIHPNYQMMVLPAEALISEMAQNSSETIVSLVSKDKKIIAHKAYLHEEVKISGEAPRFKIEINNNDIVRVSEFVEAGMIAIPYVENKKTNLIKRGSKYEVSI